MSCILIHYMNGISTVSYHVHNILRFAIAFKLLNLKDKTIYIHISDLIPFCSCLSAVKSMHEASASGFHKFGYQGKSSMIGH